MTSLGNSPSSPIPETVVRYAEDPAANDSRLVGDVTLDDPRYFIYFGPSPDITLVMRVRLDGCEIGRAVADVRAEAAGRGHRDVRWSVGFSATPSDVAERLIAAGLEPDDRPGSEPTLSVLALAGEPLPPTRPGAGVEARRVRSLDELTAAVEVDRLAFGMEPVADLVERAAAMWEREHSGAGARVYIARSDGQIVGAARAIFADQAVMLLGGGVLPEFRGRGVYRALVAARRADALAAGTPVLVVHAGYMSRPILERLGFQLLGQVRNLFDPSSL